MSFYGNQVNIISPKELHGRYLVPEEVIGTFIDEDWLTFELKDNYNINSIKVFYWEDEFHTYEDVVSQANAYINIDNNTLYIDAEKYIENCLNLNLMENFPDGYQDIEVKVVYNFLNEITIPIDQSISGNNIATYNYGGDDKGNLLTIQKGEKENSVDLGLDLSGIREDLKVTVNVSDDNTDNKYIFTINQGGKKVEEINIPLSMMLSSVEVVDNTEEQQGYLVFHFRTDEEGASTTQTVSIPLSDFVPKVITNPSAVLEEDGTLRFTNVSLANNV